MMLVMWFQLVIMLKLLRINLLGKTKLLLKQYYVDVEVVVVRAIVDQTTHVAGIGVVGEQDQLVRGRHNTFELVFARRLLSNLIHPDGRSLRGVVRTDSRRALLRLR